MKSSSSLIIFFILIVDSCTSLNALHNKYCTSRRSRTTQIAAMEGAGNLEKQKIAVIGMAGGLAETVICSLLDKNIDVSALLDEAPYSPELTNKLKSTNKNVLYYCDYDKNTATANQNTMPIMNVLENRLVVMIDDRGVDSLVGSGAKDEVDKDVEKMMNKLISGLPRSISGFVCATKFTFASEGNKIGKLFGSKTASSYKTWCEQNNIPFINLQYGNLIGGIPGCDPLPLVGLPLKEPEVDQSYVLRGVIINDLKSNAYATTEKCTRQSLAESLLQSINNVGKDQKVLEALIVSIVGKSPSTTDWRQLFSRVTNSNNIDIVRIPFKDINKPALLLNWITEFWFPQALIDADAATILTGARPVRAVNIKGKEPNEQIVKIAWEDLKPDLTSVAVGHLQISLENVGSSDEDKRPSIVVKRMATGNLPGEMQLIDKLVEGVNKNVYKKQFCTPLESFSAVANK